ATTAAPTAVRSRQKLRDVVSQPSPPTPAASAKSTRHQRVCASEGPIPALGREGLLGGYGSGNVGQPFLMSGVDVGRNPHGPRSMRSKQKYHPMAAIEPGADESAKLPGRPTIVAPQVVPPQVLPQQP